MLKLKFQTFGEIKEIELDKSRLTIGRAKDNDIVLDSPGVSRFHAEIHKDDEDNLWIIDLGSKNGTFVNGKRIEGKFPLKLWDVITIDDNDLEIIDPERQPPTLIRKVIKVDDSLTKPKDTSEHISEVKLIGISDLVKDKKFIVKSTLKVGRSPDNDIVIDDPKISRKHAELSPVRDGILVKDMDSTNGTFINNKKIKEGIAKIGDEIAFDKIVFKVQGRSIERPTLLREELSMEKTQVSPVSSEKTQMFSIMSPQFTLVGLSSGVSGKTFSLDKTEIIIGRSPDCDVVISDSTVSAHHAKLTKKEENWIIEDLNSTNGTFVDNEKISKSYLTGGEIIRLGKVELRFQAATQQTQTEETLSSKTVLIKGLEKKGLPAWSYALIVFISVVIIGGGVLFFKNNLQSNVKEPLQLNKLWEVINDNEILSTPALGDINGDKVLDVILADVKGNIFALDGKTGKELFHFQAEGGFQAPLAIGDLNRDGIADVILGSDIGKVMSIDGVGRRLWRTEESLSLGQIVNRPTLSDLNKDGIPDVIVGTTEAGLVALNGKQGWKIWDTKDFTKGFVITAPIAIEINGDGVPDIIYATNEGWIYVVDGKKGWNIWRKKLEAIGYSSLAYFEVNGIKAVIIVTKDNGIYALNVNNGKILWHSPIKDAFISSPVLEDINKDKVSDIIVISKNGIVYAIDGATGDIIWTNNDVGDQVYTTPALYDFSGDKIKDIVYITGSGEIQVIDALTGHFLINYRVSNGDVFFASPVLGDINNDKLLDIVLVSKGGKIEAYSFNRFVSTGEKIWPIFMGSYANNGKL